MSSAGKVASSGALRSLRVEGLRNVRQLRLDTEARTLVITGGNGAGKTTLLEAIYLLVRGKSFRGSKAGPLPTLGERVLRVRGDFGLADDEWLRIGFQRDQAGSRRRVEPRHWMDVPAFDWPVQVKLVSENAQVLLEGEPELRRRLLDWNVFHVEPGFGQTHRAFRRILAQRNAALKGSSKHRGIWDDAFVEAAESLTAARETFIGEWREAVLGMISSYPFLAACDLRFHRGWPEGTTLQESLAACRSDELERGFTLTGPSKADFFLVQDGRRLTCSRGQSKVIVALLQLAAEQAHLSRGRSPAIFLLDDLEAELDSRTAAILWEAFSGTMSQLIATRVSATGDGGALLMGRSADMFHVEHGAIAVAS